MRLAFIKDDDDNHNPARQQFPIFFGLLPLRNYFENYEKPCPTFLILMGENCGQTYFLN